VTFLDSKFKGSDCTCRSDSRSTDGEIWQVTCNICFTEDQPLRTQRLRCVLSRSCEYFNIVEAAVTSRHVLGYVPGLIIQQSVSRLSKASSKASSPHIAIYSFLLQMRVSSKPGVFNLSDSAGHINNFNDARGPQSYT
jgi:hypothetical protein